MSKPHTIDVTIKDRSGEKYEGVQLVCGCEGTIFQVFQLDCHNHQHLQCVSCGATLCPMASDCYLPTNVN